VRTVKRIVSKMMRREGRKGEPCSDNDNNEERERLDSRGNELKEVVK
jgi:hypothetical protein